LHKYQVFQYVEEYNTVPYLLHHTQTCLLFTQSDPVMFFR